MASYTPTNPQYAFSFSHFEWAGALLLKCQVLLRNFCNGLSFQASVHNKV